MLIDDAYRKNPLPFYNHLSNLQLDQPLGIEIKGEGSDPIFLNLMNQVGRVLHFHGCPLDII
jgi:hypothetical protein